MEFVSIFLSSLLFIASPAGAVLDQVAENAIRAQLAGVEDLEVRVDNASAVQLLQGKVEKLRIGGRGLYPVPDFRNAIAEIETDPIDLAFGDLQQGRIVLDQPLQGAVRLLMTEADLNAFLVSPAFTERLNEIQINLDNAAQAREVQRYQLANPVAIFKPNSRLRLEIDLIDQVLNETLKIEAETGLSIDNGHRLVLIGPEVLVDGAAAPSQLLDTFLENLGDQLSLKQFEESGITARVLNLSLDDENLDLAFWVRVDPSFRL